VPSGPVDDAAAAGYVRGGGGIPVDSRRVWSYLALAIAAGLLALTAVLAVAAAGEQTLASRLRQHGQRVSATVTGCVALASGTGITAAGYRCRARFTAAGRQHEALLRGSSALLPEGTTVPALVLPGEPASLTAAAAVDSGRRGRAGPWAGAGVGTWIAAAVCAALAVVAGGAGWINARHARKGLTV
jgi:hypothetical protein